MDMNEIDLTEVFEAHKKDANFFIAWSMQIINLLFVLSIHTRVKKGKNMP